MFMGSQFNSDISGWDTSNVRDMSAMFTQSQFNGDISGWNVSNVNMMHSIFEQSAFTGDISNWNLHPDVDKSTLGIEVYAEQEIVM